MGKSEVHAIDEVVGIVGACWQVPVSTAKLALVSVMAGNVSQRQHADNDAQRQCHDGSLDAGRRPQQPTASHGSTHCELMALPASMRWWRWWCFARLW